MSVLTSAPFSLPVNTLIVAKVAAINSINTGTYSTPNTAGIVA